MPLERARDIMTPLDQYAVVDESATIVEALTELERAQGLVPAGMAPHRAVLVRGRNGAIVGKLGHHGFLAALEPRYLEGRQTQTISRQGYPEEFFHSMLEQMPLWQANFDTYVRRAMTTRVAQVMHPISEDIDIDAPIGEVIHRIITCEALSLLVTERGQAVGMLRLSDLFSVVSKNIKRRAGELSGKE